MCCPRGGGAAIALGGGAACYDGAMGRGQIVLRMVLSTLGVGLWAVLAALAFSAFETSVTVPHCRDVCRSRGDELEHYRAYTRSAPRDACVCQSGQELRPSLLHHPLIFMFTAFAVLPVTGLFVWARAHDRRVAAERAKSATTR